MLYPSEVPEMIISQGREREVRQLYQSKLNLVLTWLNRRLPHQHTVSLTRWMQTISTGFDFLYLGLTNGLGLQTIGEEYVGLVQLGPNVHSRPAIPSTTRRVLMCFLQAAGPNLMEAYLRRDKDASRTLERARLSPTDLTELVIAAHTALFYVLGSSPDLSKRILGIRYATLRAQSSPILVAFFKYLGIFLLLHLAYRAFEIYRLVSRRDRKDSSQEPEAPENGDVREEYVFVDQDSNLIGQETHHVDQSTNLIGQATSLNSLNKPQKVKGQTYSSQVRCPLCLATCAYPSALPCGHIFDWDCILQAMHDGDPTCPICRCVVRPTDVVALMNV